LEPRGRGFDEHPGKKGGEATGPNPTDRAKPGSKRHLVVDAQGLPLATPLTAANVNDSVVFEDVLNAIPLLPRPFGERGHPRCRPSKVHADNGYDKPHCRRFLHPHGMGCRIARIGIESKTHLGRHRWIVERTGAWFNRFRRLRVRDERRADMHTALISLASSLILLHFL
jgi:transposase